MIRRSFLCYLGFHRWKRCEFWRSNLTLVFPKKVKLYDCENCPRRKAVTNTSYAGDVLLNIYDRTSTPRTP